MAFFENLGKKVGEAAQAAAKKSSELMEVTKINMNITQEEDKIKKLYTEMGKKIYEDYCSDPGSASQFAEQCEAIGTHRETIDNLKKRIREVKNIRVCDGCGEEIDKSTMFCPKCGAKQEIEVEEAPKAEAQGPKCPSCGAENTGNSEFCTSCGEKMGG